MCPERAIKSWSDTIWYLIQVNKNQLTHYSNFVIYMSFFISVHTCTWCEQWVENSIERLMHKNITHCLFRPSHLNVKSHKQERVWSTTETTTATKHLKVIAYQLCRFAIECNINFNRISQSVSHKINRSRNTTQLLTVCITHTHTAICLISIYFYHIFNVRSNHSLTIAVGKRGLSGPCNTQ